MLSAHPQLSPQIPLLKRNTPRTAQAKAHLDLTRSMRMPPIMSRKGWMCTGKRATVSVSAASSASYGRPSNTASSRFSQRSRAAGVMRDALGPSTSSSVRLRGREQGRLL